MKIVISIFTLVGVVMLMYSLISANPTSQESDSIDFENEEQILNQQSVDSKKSNISSNEMLENISVREFCSPDNTNAVIGLKNYLGWLVNEGEPKSNVIDIALELGVSPFNLKKLIESFGESFHVSPVISLDELNAIYRGTGSNKKLALMESHLYNLNIQLLTSSIASGKIKLDEPFRATSFFTALIQRHSMKISPSEIDLLLESYYIPTIYDLKIATEFAMPVATIEKLRGRVVSDIGVVWKYKGLYFNLADVAILKLNSELLDYWLSQNVKPFSFDRISPYEKITLPKNSSEVTNGNDILRKLLSLGFKPSNKKSIERIEKWAALDLSAQLKQILPSRTLDFDKKLKLASLHHDCDLNEKKFKKLVTLLDDAAINNDVLASNYRAKDSFSEKLVERKNVLEERIELAPVNVKYAIEANRRFSDNVMEIATSKELEKFKEYADEYQDNNLKEQRKLEIIVYTAMTNQLPLYIVQEYIDKGAYNDKPEKFLGDVIRTRRADVLRYYLSNGFLDSSMKVNGMINAIYFAANVTRILEIVNVLLDNGFSYNYIENEKDVIVLILQQYIALPWPKLEKLQLIDAIYKHGFSFTKGHRSIFSNMKSTNPVHYEYLERFFIESGIDFISSNK